MEVGLSTDERQEGIFGRGNFETVAETKVIVEFWEFDG